MKNEIVIISAVVTTLAGVGYFFTAQLGNTTKVTLENPQAIVWQKPTTDTGWAEDVKNEDLHTRSTEVLSQMLISHREKQQRILVIYDRYEKCPECIKYEYRFNENISDVDVAYNQKMAEWHDILTVLQRSIDRIENELRMRSEGFVVPNKIEGRKTKKADLEKVDEKYVRNILD